MAQSYQEFKADFARFVGLAKHKTWIPVDSPRSLRITSMELETMATAESCERVAGLVSYLEQKSGVSLTLAGGGYGCFDLGFAANGPELTTLSLLIANDPWVHETLNKVNANIVRIKTPDSEEAIGAFTDSQILVGTNRRPETPWVDSDKGLVNAFGNEFDSATHYCVADVAVLDLTRNQPKQTFRRRVWRAVSLQWIWRRQTTPRRLLLKKLTSIDDATAFGKTIRDSATIGTFVMVHGYANNFDAALRSCGIGAYLTRLDQLGRIPVLFSWPSNGNPVLYEKDVNEAEKSLRPFLEFIHTVTRAAPRPVDLMAHSHGNKILVSAVSDRTCELAGAPLARVLMVEPDVDQEYLRQRVKDLLSAGVRVSLYHSRTDRALKCAEYLASGIRAGRAGVHIDSEVAERLEVIDATAVARGLSRHAPHVESPEVIRDIHDVIEGTPPQKRFGVRKKKDPGYWEMIPS